MLKRKNDRQPPQSLDELYPDDYWLDEEDGEEELPDPAMKRRPVSGRLHDEPMVTGMKHWNGKRGVRRPNPETVTARKKPSKGTEMKKNCIRNMKKRIRKMQKGSKSWQPEQKSRQCVTQRKRKKKRADLSQHRQGSVRW